VCIASRKEKVLQESAVKLREETCNGDILYFACDVRNYESIAAMVDFVLQKWGRIDILINGAAGNFLVPFEKMTPNAFRTVVEIDLFGTFHVN
jgi:peroxisomal 2,4-dienoyl-CoA reductase